MVKRSLPSDDVEQYDDTNESVADEHSEGDIADDTTMHNDTNLHGVVELIAPDTMCELIKELDKYAEREGSAGKSRLLAPTIEKFLESCGKKDVIDATQFLKSYKDYTMQAVKGMDIQTTNVCLKHYLESGAAVRNFPGYPKHPPKLFDYYCKKNGLNGGFGNRKEVTNRMEKEVEVKQQCEKELVEMTEKYVVDLQAFIDANKAKLSPRHLQYAQAQLKRITKKTTPATPRPAKMAKKEQKNDEPALETAFDFYARSMRDKYTALSAEEREKKLQKKFKKLDAGTREIFDKLANR